MYPLPLLLETRPSVQLRRFRFGLYGLALLALFFAQLPWPARFAGLALLVAAILVAPRQPLTARLRCHGDGRLDVWHGDVWQSVRVCPDSVVWPGLIVMRWRESGRHARALVLPLDTLSPDEHRRLRLWLRWKAGKSRRELQ